MTPDPAFVTALTAYDPELRVRWGRHQARFGKPVWLVERRIGENEPQHLAHLKALDLSKARPKKLGQARTLDIAEGARGGYSHVLGIHPDLLAWSQVAPILAKADAWRQGGMAEIARQFDEQDDADEKARERHAQSVVSDRLYGKWDEIRWANKQRVNVPVEVREGYAVTDRRRLVGA